MRSIFFSIYRWPMRLIGIVLSTVTTLMVTEVIHSDRYLETAAIVVTLTVATVMLLDLVRADRLAAIVNREIKRRLGAYVLPAEGDIECEHCGKRTRGINRRLLRPGMEIQTDRQYYFGEVR